MYSTRLHGVNALTNIIVVFDFVAQESCIIVIEELRGKTA